jgi:hypothetical protein
MARENEGSASPGEPGKPVSIAADAIALLLQHVHAARRASAAATCMRARSARVPILCFHAASCKSYLYSTPLFYKVSCRFGPEVPVLNFSTYL